MISNRNKRIASNMGKPFTLGIEAAPGITQWLSVRYKKNILSPFQLICPPFRLKTPSSSYTDRIISLKNILLLQMVKSQTIKKV